MSEEPEQFQEGQAFEAPSAEASSAEAPRGESGVAAGRERGSELAAARR